jgi:hypothetical protein
MKHNTMLAVASLLSLLFLTLHITDDIVRGISKAESSNAALLVPRGLPVRDTRHGEKPAILEVEHPADRGDPNSPAFVLKQGLHIARNPLLPFR